jgi:hypothetical protein
MPFAGAAALDACNATKAQEHLGRKYVFSLMRMDLLIQINFPSNCGIINCCERQALDGLPEKESGEHSL